MATETGVGGASGAAAATNGATAAAQNNWLASEQIVQAKKELAACTTLACMAQTTGKWAAVSSVQDGATAVGIGKGLVQAGWSDVRGLAQFLSDPVTGLKGMYELINSKDMRDQLGLSQIRHDETPFFVRYVTRVGAAFFHLSWTTAPMKSA
ncbi:hypothetical protein [Burkholderia singularis]|uniref:RTX toxins determinant A and related Ca2+-binding proteins n=1 Tax=Burkholderia singularis TaxID=1503053 RepID=A0A238H7A5_9BURK|nr:hypothetical protein [Burkholderia singularis]SMG01226.1 RTX toxins determinant A and related Ca2+-binding proteins [Burkholderia singularis]